MSSGGIRSSPMSKCLSDRCVCAPQYMSPGTSIAPMLSDSVRFKPFISSIVKRELHVFAVPVENRLDVDDILHDTVDDYEWRMHQFPRVIAATRVAKAGILL